jgi:GNAT superfamily N-acetyltransferase
MSDAQSDAAAQPTHSPEVRIEWYTGPRAGVRHLFELADDSERVLDSYLDKGRVLVALCGDHMIGHLQLVDEPDLDAIELKSLAVVESWRGRGVGRALVQRALAECAGSGRSKMLVATGAADAGNLRFYQRLGFRMLRIERDAFTPATGYPEGIEVDGIPLLDRVWFDQRL